MIIICTYKALKKFHPEDVAVARPGPALTARPLAFIIRALMRLWIRAALAGLGMLGGNTPTPGDELLGPFDLMIQIAGTPQHDGQILLRAQDYDLVQQEEFIALSAGEPPDALATKIEIVLQELLAIHDRHLLLQSSQLIVQEFFSKEFYSQSVLIIRSLVPGVTITLRALSRDSAFLTTAFFTDRSSNSGHAELDVISSRLGLPGHFALAVPEDTPGEALWEPFSAQMRHAGWRAVTVPTWGVVVTNLTQEDQFQARVDAPGLGVGLYRLDPEAVLYPFGCDDCNRQGSGGG